MKRVNFVTSLVLPNYHNDKKDVNENENSSHCFPDDLITLTAFSICEENQGEKLNLSQPACIGRRVLPLLFKSINRYKLHTFWKLTLVVTLNVCVPSNSGRWHHRLHLWECMFLYVGIHLATPRTFPWWCFFFFSFFSCLIIIFFIVLTC